MSVVYRIFRHELVIFLIIMLPFLFLWLMRFEKKLAIHWKTALLVACGHIVFGWLSSRLMGLIEVGFDVEKAAKMRLYGSVFVLPLLYYLWAKKTKREINLVMDFAAICVILGLFLGRLNCFKTSCCQGMLIVADGTLRWPIRELEMLFYILFIAIYAGKIQKRKTHGEVYPIYMIAYGILRFLCEFVREEYTTQVGFLHLAHVWSILSIAAGAIWLCLLNRKRKLIPRKKYTKS